MQWSALANQSERNRLVYEMMMQCETQPQREAALQIVCCLWDKTLPLTKRNELLVSLLASYQEREQQSWCIAVLRLGCYPVLTSVAKVGALSWDEAISGFDRAVEAFDFKDSSHAKKRLTTRALAWGRGEDRAGMREETVARRAAAEMKLHPLEDVLSGLVVDPLEGITEERAREILKYFCASGDYQLLPQDIDPILKKLYHPEQVPNDRERKAKSRALARAEKAKGVTKLPPRWLSLQGEKSPGKKRK